MPRCRPNVARIRPKMAKLGCHQPILDQPGSIPVIRDQVRPISAEVGPNSAKVGPVAPTVGENSAEIGHTWPGIGQIRPSWAKLNGVRPPMSADLTNVWPIGHFRPSSIVSSDFDRCWAESRRCGPNAALRRQMLLSIRPTLAKIRRCFDSGWADGGDTWP